MKNPSPGFPSPPEPGGRRRLALRLLAALALAIVLALIFLAYLTPSFVFDLANRIVLCF